MPDPYVLVPYDTFDGRGAGDRVEVPGDVAHHLGRVLRLRDGASVVAADGDGTEVAATVADGGLALVTDPVRVPQPEPRTIVWQALGKGRKHDEVVRVCTELGVDEVMATVSDRTIVDVAGKQARVRERWRAVARAACEQARRPHLPVLTGPCTVTELLAGIGPAHCLVAHVGATTDPLRAATALLATRPEEVVVAVGPEGGWTDGEVAAFTAAGATPVALGPTVLRTEHAAAVLATVVLAAAGRLAGSAAGSFARLHHLAHEQAPGLGSVAGSVTRRPDETT